MRIITLIAATILASSLYAQENSTERPTYSPDKGAQTLTKVDAKETKALKASKKRSEAKTSVYKPKK